MPDPIKSPGQILTAPDPVEERQRRMRQLAVTGMLMGVQPTQMAGKAVMDSADDDTKRKDISRRKYLGQGFIMEPDGTVTRDEGMAAAEVEREGRLLSRMGYQNELITGRPQLGTAQTAQGTVPTQTTRGANGPSTVMGAPLPGTAPGDVPAAPTAGQEQEGRQWSGISNDLDTLASTVSQAPSINDPLRAGAIGLAGQIAPRSVEGIARNWATEKLTPAKELPTVYALRNKFHSVLQAMSGLATTDSERANLQAWAASEGQGPAAMSAAITEMQNFARNKARAATGRPYAPVPSQGGSSGVKKLVRNPQTGKLEEAR